MNRGLLLLGKNTNTANDIISSYYYDSSWPFTNTAYSSSSGSTIEYYGGRNTWMEEEQEQDYYLLQKDDGSGILSFVEAEEHHGRMELTPPQQQQQQQQQQQNDDETSGEQHVKTVEKEEGGGSSSKEQLNDEDEERYHPSNLSNDDIICVNCHALFRIHVDISFQGQVDSSSLLSSTTLMNMHEEEDDEEEKSWFIMLRDVTTHNDDQWVYAQMDRPIDLRCGSVTTINNAVEVHSNECSQSFLQHKGKCNVHSHKHQHHNAYNTIKTCQSNVIIEVPYTSFTSLKSTSSSSFSDASQYNHETTPNERIILVSLLREWNSSDFSNVITTTNTKTMMMKKKRRIVDQWMINIIVPPPINKKNNIDYGGGGSVVHPSIHSAKLRDVVNVVKYDSVELDDDEESIKELLGFTSDTNASSSSMYEIIAACLVGAFGGVVILVAAFKFVPAQFGDEEEEEEEELMTTPSILALQHSMMRDSNSLRHGHNAEHEESSQDYASGENDQTPTEERELQSARKQSTPTNLSPLFDDEAEASDVASNQDDEDVDGIIEEDVIGEQVNLADEARGEDNGGSGSYVEEEEGEVEEAEDTCDTEEKTGEVEDDTIQEQAEKVENARGEEDKTAPRMMDENDDDASIPCSVDQDEETPPTSNKRSTALRTYSLDDADDILQEQNESTDTSSPLFYSPKYQSDETAPLPHSNTSSQVERVCDQGEHADGAESNRALMLLSNPAEANHPPIDYRAEWNEFGAYASNCEVFNADNDDAIPTYSGDSALSVLSKRLLAIATSKQPDDEAAKASSMKESRADSAFDDESNEVDEAMFIPNVNVQVEVMASPPNLHQQRNAQTEVIASPPKVHHATMESNAFPNLNSMNTPTESTDEFDETMFLPNVNVQAGESGSPQVQPPAESQQAINLQLYSQTDRCKSPLVSSLSNETCIALKTFTTPPPAPMSLSKEDNASAASFTSSSAKKLRLDANEASTTDTAASENLGNERHPSSLSPKESHHDLSYVNRSLSVSSSPSVTSAARNSKSPSITYEPRLSPCGWNRSDNGSNEEVQQRKSRSLPFVSRDYTCREKENASSNSRTPLTANPTLYSPSSTVAATVAEFAAPRTTHLQGWRAERPIPVPTGSAGQNKRLGGSPDHFEPHGPSDGEDESSTEPVDFMNGADCSSRNDSQNVGSSRSGKRSWSSKDGKSKKSASRKRHTNVEKKLLATIKTSDKHKPPSGLSCLSQRLEEGVWEV